MSIENLKKTLESEKDLAYLDWLFPKELNINNKDESIKSNNHKRRLDYETYIVGYEAATNRLLPLLQKAEEEKDTYERIYRDYSGWMQDRDDSIKILKQNYSNLAVITKKAVEIVEIVSFFDDINGETKLPEKAREFLAELTKMTEIKNV